MRENQTIIRKNAGKQVLLLLGCLVFAIICFYFMNGSFKSSRYSPGFLKFVGMIGIVFFGLAGTFIVFSLLRSSPALIIHEKGILNYSHVGSGYLIEWDNLKSLRIITVSGKKMIAMELKDNQKVFDQLNVFSRSFMKLNARFSGTPVFITSAMIEMKIEDILALIRQKRRELKKEAKAQEPTEITP